MTLAGYGLLAALLGCSKPAQQPEAPRVCVAVTSEQDTNAGLPFQMLVRAVDDKTYREESYDTVADKVAHPDATVLARAVVFAGVPRTLWVKQPDATGLGIYFLFTDPQGDWKALVIAPGGQFAVKLVASRIDSIARLSADSCPTGAGE